MSAREVVSEVMQFVLSIIIICGGGFMVYNGVAVELSSGLIGIVITYWFQNKSNESAVGLLFRQSPIVKPIENNNVTPTQQVLECDSNSVKQP